MHRHGCQCTPWRWPAEGVWQSLLNLLDKKNQPALRQHLNRPRKTKQTQLPSQAACAQLIFETETVQSQNNKIIYSNYIKIVSPWLWLTGEYQHSERQLEQDQFCIALKILHQAKLALWMNQTYHIHTHHNRRTSRTYFLLANIIKGQRSLLLGEQKIFSVKSCIEGCLNFFLIIWVCGLHLKNGYCISSIIPFKNSKNCSSFFIPPLMIESYQHLCTATAALKWTWRQVHCPSIILSLRDGNWNFGFYLFFVFYFSYSR